MGLVRKLIRLIERAAVQDAHIAHDVCEDFGKELGFVQGLVRKTFEEDLTWVYHLIEGADEVSETKSSLCLVLKRHLFAIRHIAMENQRAIWEEVAVVGCDEAHLTKSTEKNVVGESRGSFRSFLWNREGVSIL